MNKEMWSALDSLLSGLNRDQLQALVLRLAEQEPSFITTIEKQVAVLRTSSQATTSSSAAPTKTAVAVDTKAIRRQVRSSIHSLDRMRASEAYW